MRVDSFAKEMNLTVLTEAGDAEIRDVCIGDLLSIVMNTCSEGSLWITQQTHPNILQVASLSDAAAIVIPAEAGVEQSLIDKAEDMGVCLLSSELGIYELAWRTHEVLK
ncbi:MAG: hypothetical protein IJ109_01510 [Firmicutes bacterium]|nr:hypothetical protein [Bacillota bacterium]